MPSSGFPARVRGQPSGSKLESRKREAPLGFQNKNPTRLSLALALQGSEANPHRLYKQKSLMNTEDLTRSLLLASKTWRL